MSATGGISSPAAEPQAGVSALRWRQVFDGDEAQVREVRQWLTRLLPECPSRDDVVLVASELSGNAIAHTASGRGGLFAVEVTWQGATVRVSVADAGAPSVPRLIDDPMADGGRGLLIVQNLCSRTGVSGDHRGRLVWGEVFWAGPAAPSVYADKGHEAAIRDGLALLARQHCTVPVWFGCFTLQWWALTGRPGHRRLITAPTPHELGHLISTIQASPPGPAMPAPDTVAARADRRVRPAQLPVPSRTHLLGPLAGRLRPRPC
jgi:serine/threonine-protein kinase RsbW